MEYDELIEKIKDALKITKLELYEKRIYEPFSKMLGWMVTKQGLTKPTKMREKNTILRFYGVKTLGK